MLYHVAKPLPLINVHTLVDVNTSRIEAWQYSFAKKVINYFHSGKKVMISDRAFSPLPKQEWGWVEGEDKRIHWDDIPKFAALFEVDRITSSDGFVELLNNATNMTILKSILTRTTTPKV